MDFSVRNTVSQFELSKIQVQKLLSLRELCNELSISVATGRNWIKLGKLIPQYTEKRTPYFEKDYVAALKNEIMSGKNKALKSRRNKKYVSGNALYNSYVSEDCKNILVLQNLLAMIEEEKIKLDMDVIQYIVADCALHLFIEKKQLSCKDTKNLLCRYLTGEIQSADYKPFIDALIKDKKAALAFCNQYPQLFSLDYIFEPEEDILGLIYISCKNIGNRKAMGTYYTPTKVVKRLISKLDINGTDKILDPACGTGNFLLQLPETVCFDNVYGNDMDSVSVKIARLNMALKYSDVSIDEICRHITELDFLTEYPENKFDCIIGNPPWGYAFSEEEKKELRKIYKAAAGKNIESYDVFIECALSRLDKKGRLSYVLPEAVLNVKAHTYIREIMLKNSAIQYLEFLGNAFDGVQCPCILLQIIYTGCPLSTIGMSIDDGKQTFCIETERAVSPECFSFVATDTEYRVLEKLKNTEGISTLAGNADFALGIVTGNNKEYISTKKNKENEMVLKGSDIRKYHINQTDNYIVFKPESFQQTAPEKLYRAPEKLLYRFICNQLVFAYDDKQTLSLNSCNIIIPKLKNVKMKYILAILNSSVAQFIYRKEFNSVKVLRSHIESIPIPIVDERLQDRIIDIVNFLIQGQELGRATELYEELDEMIFDMFHLSNKERTIIQSAVDWENKFLT